MKCEVVEDTNKLFAWMRNLHGVGMVVYEKKNYNLQACVFHCERNIFLLS